MTIWAFNKADDATAREMIYQSVLNGISRFGWSERDDDNLYYGPKRSTRSEKQLFLLQIQPGDWIVHINTPVWGRCVAAQVLTGYKYDEGLRCAWGPDFRHCFDVDTNTVIEFDRHDPNIIPTVNLKPRQRYQRILDVGPFLSSIQNLKLDRVHLRDGETREEYHLRESTEKYLVEIAKLIHEMHRSKKLEHFLAKVFRRVPGVSMVDETGAKGGKDYGADLVLTVGSDIGNLDLVRKIVIQVKSYGGSHSDTYAVDQVKEGIKHYSADAGMVVTTATPSEEFEHRVQEVAEELDCPIDLLASEELTRFIMKHAPDMLFRLDGIA